MSEENIALVEAATASMDSPEPEPQPETKPEPKVAVDRLVEQAMQQSDEVASAERLRDPEY